MEKSGSRCIAQFETEIRKECQLSGIVKLQENGVKFSAKSKLSNAQVNEMVLDRQ